MVRNGLDPPKSCKFFNSPVRKRYLRNAWPVYDISLQHSTILDEDDEISMNDNAALDKNKNRHIIISIYKFTAR